MLLVTEWTFSSNESFRIFLCLVFSVFLTCWCWSSEGLLQCRTVQRWVLMISTLSWAVDIWTFGNNQLFWVCFRDGFFTHSSSINKFCYIKSKSLFVSLFACLFVCFPNAREEQGYERLKLQNCSSRSALMLDAKAFMEWSIAKLASRTSTWGNGSGQWWKAAMPLSTEAPYDCIMPSRVRAAA